MLLEGCSKLAVLVAVCNVFIRGSDVRMYSNEDLILLIMFSTQILFEIGQLISVDLHLRKYFHSFWNVLDCFSYVCICVWVVLCKNPKYNYIAYASLSLAAIPLSMQMLQYLSLYRPFGILVLVIKSMTQNLLLFFWLYIALSLGFILCFHNIFYEATALRKHFIELLLFLFQTTFYELDYARFLDENTCVNNCLHTNSSSSIIDIHTHHPTNCSLINSTLSNNGNRPSILCSDNVFIYQVFGQSVYTVFVIISLLFIYELFIARIWGSYYEATDVAHDEYAFTMVCIDIYASIMNLIIVHPLFICSADQ